MKTITKDQFLRTAWDYQKAAGIKNSEIYFAYYVKLQDGELVFTNAGFTQTNNSSYLRLPIDGYYITELTVIEKRHIDSYTLPETINDLYAMIESNRLIRDTYFTIGLDESGTVEGLREWANKYIGKALRLAKVNALNKYLAESTEKLKIAQRECEELSAELQQTLTALSDEKETR